MRRRQAANGVIFVSLEVEAGGIKLTVYRKFEALFFDTTAAAS